MRKRIKASGVSGKLSQFSALLGLVSLVACCIYGAVFQYFDLVVLLTIALGVVCMEGYVLSSARPAQLLNMFGVAGYSYAVGLFFLNSYPVWADWYGNFTMYGSRGGIAPVVAIIVLLLVCCVTGIISCFTAKGKDVGK